MGLHSKDDRVRLNIGCGRHVLDGWVNVDVVRSPRAKRDPEVFALAHDIPLESGCADEVMAIHVIEHFYYWKREREDQEPGVFDVLAEWRRLLKKGGVLTLELPDIEKCARNLLAGDIDNLHMWGFYGDPSERDPYMCHRWGYTPKTMEALLLKAGFADIRHGIPQWHARGKDKRDMRVTARKA